MIAGSESKCEPRKCLPVAVMPGGGLVKSQLPFPCLFHPRGTQMLIARRRTFILIQLFANDGVVSDDRYVVADGGGMHVVGRQLEQIGVAEIVDRLLAFEEPSIDVHQGKICCDDLLEEFVVVFISGLDEAVLSGNEKLFERARRLGCLSLSRGGRQQQQGKNQHAQELHGAPPEPTVTIGSFGPDRRAGRKSARRSRDFSP